ncbi:MAG: hypothetical protein J6X69_06680 [Bacteroidales bacterium]|nr:hypothetical protein [Bacteroidales bacterium]
MENNKNINNCTDEIPQGKTREEIRIRERIIKDFYAKWISENPSKSVWNNSLKAEIKVKQLSYNETHEHAARSYESTMAVFQLSDILSKAIKVSSGPKKQGDKNQRCFSRIVIMRYKNIRLVVGFQPSKGEYVQYSITARPAEDLLKK